MASSYTARGTELWNALSALRNLCLANEWNDKNEWGKELICGWQSPEREKGGFLIFQGYGQLVLQRGAKREPKAIVDDDVMRGVREQSQPHGGKTKRGELRS
jgi:hypothetical protein